MNSLDEKVQNATETLVLVLAEQLKHRISTLSIPNQSYKSDYEHWQQFKRGIYDIRETLESLQRIWTL